jgi:hypothetical protein
VLNHHFMTEGPFLPIRHSFPIRIRLGAIAAANQRAGIAHPPMDNQGDVRDRRKIYPIDKSRVPRGHLRNMEVMKRSAPAFPKKGKFSGPYVPKFISLLPLFRLSPSEFMLSGH